MEFGNQVDNSGTFNGFMQTAGAGLIGQDAINTTITTGSWGYPGSYVWYSNPSWENKTEKAYQVIRALMKAKVIRIQTLDKFFSVMDEVIKVV